MSIMPLWPNLQPRATDPLWFNADRPCDDESEVLALEAEHHKWRERIRTHGYATPIGKTRSDMRGPPLEEEEEEEEDEVEGEEGEEEESDTHEEEEEELDEIDMEVSYSHQQQRSSPMDTVSEPVSIRMVSNDTGRS
nr:anaphase-promoting complex subunit 15-like [Megalopta genalis]